MIESFLYIQISWKCKVQRSLDKYNRKFFIYYLVKKLHGRSCNFEDVKNTNISARDLDADQDPPPGGGGGPVQQIS